MLNFTEVFFRKKYWRESRSHLTCFRGIRTPLDQTLPLWSDVQILETLGLDDEDLTAAGPNDEIRVVMSNLSGCVDVLHVEVHTARVLGESLDVLGLVQELGKPELKVRVTNDAIKYGLLRDHVGLVVDHDWSRLREFDFADHRRRTNINEGQIVDGSGE